MSKEKISTKSSTSKASPGATKAAPAKVAVKVASSAETKSATKSASTKSAAKAPAKATIKSAEQSSPLAATSNPAGNAQSKGASLTLNGKKYLIAHFSKDALAHLELLRFANAEVKRLDMLTTLTKTAMHAHKNALVAALPAAAE